MSAVAVFVYGAFLVLAFGWRTWVRYRDTGDTGYRGSSGDAGLLERVAGVLFVVAIVVCFANGLLVLVGVLSPFAPIHRALALSFGIVVVVLGAAVALAAQAHMGAAWRIGVDPSERSTLVRTGLFAYARNPFFTGLMVASSGMSIAYTTPLGLVGWLLLLLGAELQVRRVEEPYLSHEFGPEYDAYSHAVGRFMPWVGRTRSG